MVTRPCIVPLHTTILLLLSVAEYINYVLYLGDDGGGQDTGVVIIAVITGILLLAILVIAGLATSVAVYISIDRKRKGDFFNALSLVTALL